MLNLKHKIEEAGAHLYEYYETVTELKKMQTLEKASSAFSAAAAGLIIAIVMLILLVFISITAALLIADKTGSMYTGFLYVTLFYLLLGILLIVFRNKWIRYPMQNTIIKSFFSHEHED